MCQPVTAATPDVTRASTSSATRRSAPVDHQEPDLAPGTFALAVDLLGGQLGTGLARWPEDPGRALQGDHQGDVEVVVTHSHSLSV